MSYQIEIGHLEECIDRRRFVVLSHGPPAHLTEVRDGPTIGCKEHVTSVFPHPVGEFVRSGGDLVGNLVDAEYLFGTIAFDQPFSECRAEIEPVMKVLRLNENIRVEQVDHPITPNSRAAS